MIDNVRELPFSSSIYNTKANFWAKDMRQIVLLPCVHVAHLLCFAWVKFSFLTSFITIFGIGFHKSLGTYRDSYWLLQLEDVVHLQTCLFAFFFFFFGFGAMGFIDWPIIPKKTICMHNSISNNLLFFMWKLHKFNIINISTLGPRSSNCKNPRNNVICVGEVLG